MKIILIMIAFLQFSFAESFRIIEIHTNLQNHPYAFTDKEDIKGIHTDIIHNAMQKVGFYTEKLIDCRKDNCLKKLSKDEILVYLVDNTKLTNQEKNRLKDNYKIDINYQTKIKDKEYIIDLSLYFSNLPFIFKDNFSKYFNLSIDIMKNNQEIDDIINHYIDNSDEKVVDMALYEWGGFMSSRSLDSKGMFAEIISSIWKEAGYKVNFTFASPHYSDLLTRWGNVAAKAPAHENPSKYKSFFYSNPILALPIDLFYKRDNFPDGIKGDLEKYKIGAVRKYFYQDNLDKKRLNIIYFDTEEELYKALILNNIDLLVSSRNLFIEVMLKYTSTIHQFALYEDKFLDEQQISVAFAKSYYNSEYLLDLFNKSFEKVKDDGTINKILKKYGLID